MASLFEQFPAISKEQWLAKVTKDLKGKPIESLNWQIEEQLTLSPFAHAEDLSKAYVPISNSQNSNNWEIGVKIQVVNLQLANQEALNALKNGANAIAFEISKSLSLAELKILLSDIQLEWISTHFIFKQKSWKRFLESFIVYTQEKNYDAAKLACSFSIKGKIIDSAKAANNLQKIHVALPKATLFTIKNSSNSINVKTVIEELAQLIYKGNNCIQALSEHQLDLVDFCSKIQFSMSLSDSYFFNIASIRALKLLWQQVLIAWDNSLNNNTNIEIHLNTNTQTDNENYNKIKATAQAMAAVIAGINRLYIYPSDEHKDGIGTPFAQRIALNIQHLMEMESYMNRVIDPSAGSYYIENLTNTIAEKAWQRFQEMI